MKEKISRGIFWVLSIGAIIGGLILSILFFLINRSMILQAIVIPIFGFVINPLILDKILKYVFKTEVKYFSVIVVVLIYGGVNLALVIAYTVFNIFNNEIINDNAAWQNFESILQIVVFFYYLVVLFVSKKTNKVAKYVTFGVIYLICVILSFASLPIHYTIVNILNLVNELDFLSYEVLINDILIPIREAILTYIIFDTIMGNENRKHDKIDIMDVKKIREDKVIKDNIMTKCQLHSRRNKKKKKYTPYNFDEKLEYKIYDNIGERYKKEFMGKKTKANEEYPDFDKYKEWRKYFKKKFLIGVSNKHDFKKFLNRRLRIYQRFREVFLSVALPIYIGIITTEIELFSNEYYPTSVLISAMVVGAISILVISIFFVHKYSTRICFFEDCIDLL